MSQDREEQQSESSPPMAEVDAWLDRHGDAMYAFALKRLGRPEDAEDVVQEALLGAIRAVDRFRGESAERTWLIGIVLHKVQDVLRKRARETAWRTEIQVQMEEWPPEFTSGGFAMTPRDWDAMLPDKVLQSEEMRLFIDDQIARLPIAMRAAFCLRELDGVPTDEICKLLGITPTNLWTLVHRAKLRLREAIADRWGGD